MIPRYCLGCAARYEMPPAPWRCAACGKPLDLDHDPSAEALVAAVSSSRPGTRGIAQWTSVLPLERDVHLVTRGECGTPLVEDEFASLRVFFLLDSLNPSGSYKDRGAAVMVAALKAEGARSLVADSSGNAGAAIALYASLHGLPVTVYAPVGISEGKKRLMERFGAAIELCEGVTAAAAREGATGRAQRAEEEPGVVYASHVWQPSFRAGVKTAAYEIASALLPGGPGAVVFPVGHGVLALSLALGFRHLVMAGLLPRDPMLIGVQAGACAPVMEAFAEYCDITPSPGIRGETACEGIRIASPPLVDEIVGAVAASGGEIVSVSDDQTRRGLDALWKHGYSVEITSAVVAAALASHGRRWRERLDSAGVAGPIVAILTGSGLKASPGDGRKGEGAQG